MRFNLLLLISILSPTQVRRHSGKLLIALLGISLGTATYTAIRLATRASLESLSSSTDRLTEWADIVLTSESGSVPESALPALASLPFVKHLAPLSVRYATTKSNAECHTSPVVQVIGADIIGLSLSSGVSQDSAPSPYAVALSTIPCKQISIVVQGKQRTFNLTPPAREVELLKSYGGNVLVLDIADFQDLFQIYGGVEKVGLILANKEDSTLRRPEIQKLLPEGVMIQENPKGELEHLTRAFRLNLNFFAFLALLVSSALIYNAVSFMILQRKTDLQILRALGAGPKTLQRMLFLEAGILGLLASVLGVFLGSILSHFLVREVSETVSNLYSPTIAESTRLSPDILFSSIALGVATCLLGSASPVLEGARVTVLEARGRSGSSFNFLTLGLGIFLIASAFISTSLIGSSAPTLLGFLPPGLLTVGFLFTAPLFSKLVLSGVSSVRFRFGPGLQIARSFLEVSGRRVVATVAAVSLALGLFLGVSGMIGSFRLSVQHWLDSVLKADVFISSSDGLSGVSGSGLPSEILTSIHQAPETELVDSILSKNVLYRGDRVLVHGIDFGAIALHDRLEFLPGQHPSNGLLLHPASDSALVSESFVRRFGNQVEINLPGNSGYRRYKVEGIFRDYSSDRGVIYLPQESHRALFGETPVQGLSIYLKAGTDSHRFISKLRENYPELTFFARSNQELKAEVFRIFDQTFVVTKALQIIALIISLFVIVNTVLMLSTERVRDLALLKAIGAARWQRQIVFLCESSLLGLIGGISGIIQGFLLSLLLVYFVNRFFFGWSISYHPDLFASATTLAGVVLLSGLCGVLLSRSTRVSAQELRYE